MREALGASRSGFYLWLKAQDSRKARFERYLLIKIKKVYDSSKGVYGSRRIMKELRPMGVECYYNKIVDIMREHRIKAKTKRKYKATTNSKHNLKISSNLLERNFNAKEINRVWTGDITYVWTREGWLYLSTVIDLYSRKVVGWSLGKRLTADLVLSSLDKAVKLRKPEAGLIFHSDRGAQYAGDKFREALRRIGAVQSMSRKGDCWDNAVAESFFKTIKSELVYWHNFQNRKEAELIIFEYIEVFYNRKRLHSTINYMTPDAFENQNPS